MGCGLVSKLNDVVIYWDMRRGVYLREVEGNFSYGYVLYIYSLFGGNFLKVVGD